MQIISNVRVIIQHNKAASAYDLIGKLRPILLDWANYFKFVECKKTFSKVDNIVYQQIRAWVFRRAVRQGREKVKEKYFPTGNTYKFSGRDYKANWVLNGVKTSKNNKGKKIHLPKLSWVKSSQFIKIKGNFSVYDGNEVYWATRTPRYSPLSTSNCEKPVSKKKNKGQIGSKAFKEGDVLEVDQVNPQSKGGP
jgi:RNA-directed DNA polymerase